MRKPAPLLLFIYKILSLLPASAEVLDGELNDPSGDNNLFQKLNTVILIKELDKITAVKKNGSFHFEDIPGGTYTLAIVIPRLQEEKTTVNVPDENKIIIIVLLKAVPIEITETKKKLPPGTEKLKKDLLWLKDSEAIYEKTLSEKRNPFPSLRDGDTQSGINIGPIFQILIDLVTHKKRNKNRNYE